MTEQSQPQAGAQKEILRPELRRCPACRGIVSVDAKACPRCGEPIKERVHAFLMAIIYLLLFISLAAVFNHATVSVAILLLCILILKIRKMKIVS